MNTNHAIRLKSWVGVLATLICLSYALWHENANAATAKTKINFDHVRTGFPLSGAHAQIPCETCHIQGTFKGTPKKCAACHSAGSRVTSTTVKPPNHVPTNQECDTCHFSTSSWKVARFSHVGVSKNQCQTCHNGNIVEGKKPNHFPTSLPCDACHRTTTWSNASFDHAGIAPNTCNRCHAGNFAGVTTKSPGHPVTSASCDTCHTGFVSFSGLMSGSFNHAGVMPHTCANSGCHLVGGSGLPKTNDHIPTSLACDYCHNSTTTFKSSSFTHAATQGVMPNQCSGCHDGTHTSSNALGKTPSPPHPVTNASCDTCHTGYTSFAGANPHNGVIASAGTCANSGCHAPGGAGKQKTSDHIPTILSCNLCHNMTTFTQSSFTHAAIQGVVASQCSGCHDGTHTSSGALGKPSTNHPITTASCDTCHTGYVTFANASHHAGVIQGSGACANAGCHAPGGAGTQKGTGHLLTTLSCDSCHNMSAFKPSSFTHSATQGVTPTNCVTCHNGSVTNADAAPGGHIPMGSAACSACHTTTSFTPSTFNHSATQNVIPGQCVTCHNGSYAGLPWNARGKPSNHIPYESQLLGGSGMGCDTCHTSKTSFATVTMNHNNSMGNGAGWCKGCHDRSTSFAGNMEKKALTHEKSTGVTDCSQSGCHRPLGNRGTPYTKW